VGSGGNGGPVVSGRVRERVREGRAAWQWGADWRARQHSVSRLRFKPTQKYSNGSNEIQIPLNFGGFKRYLTVL
jgi:hypothetical protein